MLITKFKARITTSLFFILFIYGCTKIDTTTLGANLIPVVDNIHTFDTTLSVIANNVDSVVCDSVLRTDLHALGYISDDPYFGKTTANIYLELKPQSYPFGFPASDADSLLLDSAVIVLQYSHSYGDTTLNQGVQVYKLMDKFKVDTTYTTCNLFNYDNAALLGAKAFVPARLNDSIHAFREDANNQLRIRLDDTFAKSFITDSATIFKNDTTYTDFLKGFAITPDQTFDGNAINYFDLTSTNTRLSFYLRTSVGTTKDTSVIDFPLTGFSGEANSIVRERNASEITNAVSHSPAGDSIIYIQTSPGSFAELKIPGLSGLSNRVIHRAELIVDQVYSANPSDTYFTTPDLLYLDTKNDTSSTVSYFPIPCDFTTVSLQPDFTIFGGNRKLIDDDNGHQVSQYVFNISRYVQDIVTKGGKNATLRLQAPYTIFNRTSYTDLCNQLVSPFNISLNTIAQGRIKINGTNKTSTRLRLHIVYSTL